jgi:hypothetical protein
MLRSGDTVLLKASRGVGLERVAAALRDEGGEGGVALSAAPSVPGQR